MKRLSILLSLFALLILPMAAVAAPAIPVTSPPIFAAELTISQALVIVDSGYLVPMDDGCPSGFCQMFLQDPIHAPFDGIFNDCYWSYVALADGTYEIWAAYIAAYCTSSSGCYDCNCLNKVKSTYDSNMNDLWYYYTHSGCIGSIS